MRAPSVKWTPFSPKSSRGGLGFQRLVSRDDYQTFTLPPQTPIKPPSKSLARTCSASGLVVIGMDTRESSEKLSALVKKGVEAAGAKVLDMGLSTTPQVDPLEP
jgi:hypothetical protein